MPVRIVLVDDHELLRTGLRLRIQREEGLEVVADAGDAAAAYAAIAAKLPELVVMDLDLPGENGLTATAAIKARWPKTRVLALTGSKPAAVTHSAILAGADGVIFKGEASDDLVRAIRAVVAGKIFLSPDAATGLIGLLRQTPPAAPASTGPALSDRERAVLKGLADGRSYKEVATQIGIGVKSVDTYRARLAKKLGCTTRAELVRCAIRLGLVKA
jgi:DNA-binding NarL/FixJ family response regulator